MLNEDGEVRWVHFKKLMEVVEGVLMKNYRYNKAMPDGATEYERWCWTSNSRCKYIGIRIDMRDGHGVLFDRDGNCISIEQLQFQLTPNAVYPGTHVIPLEEWAERDLGTQLVSDIKGHIEEFVESTNDVDDLFRAILVSIRQNLRETKSTKDT